MNVAPPTKNASPQAAREQVLSTMNQDGSRRWLRPRPSAGRFLWWRRIVAWLLMVVFTATPFITVDGRPALLLDLAARQFTIHGVTFQPTETLLLALLLLTVFVAIFLATAMLGRVWCGWGCPQTVYMEFLFRPIERLIEGRYYRSPNRTPRLRLLLKWSVFAGLALYLANTFLAYFVGVERLSEWVTRSPLEHPSAFLIVLVVTLLMLLNFGFFREQMCTLVCPYGRFQSVLLDRSSLIISYDQQRGEPRGPLRRSDPAADQKGDCVDCRLCVSTCPTGIDIRDGLQMECVACAQCIDACDAVMDKVGRDRGLIRYSSQQAMESGRRRFLRPRVVIYPLLLIGVLSALLVNLAARTSTDITFLRNRTTPYSVTGSGEVSNLVKIKLTNKGTEANRYQIELVGDGQLIRPGGEVLVGSGESVITSVFVLLQRDAFDGGRAQIGLRITDDAGEVHQVEHRVLGPLFSGDLEPGDPR